MSVLIVDKGDLSVDCAVRGYKSQFLRGSKYPGNWCIRSFDYGMVNRYGLKIKR